MAVPVVLGSSSFDYIALRAEQARLSKQLLIPSPREQDDTSKVFEVEDNQTPPTKYPTYIKVTYDPSVPFPQFRLYMKDNLDVEIDLSAVGPLTINGAANNIASAQYAISPITGQIAQGTTVNATTGLLVGGTLRGVVKFDGVTGLSLAALNERIADISNAIEGITKVLSVVSGNIDAALNVIR